MAGISSGPTPWWQLPEYAGSQANLESSAPEGYQYDPVQMQYTRTPTSAGTNLSDFMNAASGGSSPLSALSAAANGSAGGGVSSITTGTSGTPSGGGGSAAVNPIQPIDMTAANAASFGAAKDQAGQLAKASLTSLRNAAGASGQLGGGMESQGEQNIIENSAGLLGDEVRNEETTNANQALNVATQNQNSALTQRGQDIQSQEAAAQLALSQAEFNSNNSLNMLKLALSAIPAMGGGASGSQYVY